MDILEEEQESDNSPGWHTETQGSKTYKYYNNSAGNRLKGYRKIKKDYYFFSQKSGYAVCNGWKYVRIKGKKYKLYFFDKKGRRSDPTKKLGSKARYDAFCGANKDTRMAVRFIVEVAWQAHFVTNMFSRAWS